jgi:hypothetical protein
MNTPSGLPTLIGATFNAEQAARPTSVLVPVTQPVFDAAQIQLQRRMRFNPLRMLNPEMLSLYLDQFDIGILNLAARLWEAMCKRDDTLSFVKQQLEDSIASKPWGVFMQKNADAKEAARHKACLDWFYDHIVATDAFDRNVRGGRHLLIRQMMNSASYQYAVHHILWRPQPGASIQVDDVGRVPVIAATLEHVPLQYFENTSGTLRFLPMGGYGIEGQELDWNREWICTTGAGLMFAASISYVFKRLTFQDWTIFNERYAQPKVIGMTTAQRDSDAGRHMEEIVANFNGDQGIVLSEVPAIGEKPPISLLGPEGTVSVDLFERFLDRQDRKITVMYRGSDLANMSRERDTTGVSAQSKETERLEMAHCQRIADAMRQLDRMVIRFCFGESVEPLANFGLPDMDDEDAQQLRESAGFLADRGAQVDLRDTAERLGVTLTESPEDALQPIGRAAAGDVQGEERQAVRDLRERTDNARARRLERLVKEALNTPPA